MDAIITAGGIPKPEDPLYEYTQGKSKACVTWCECAKSGRLVAGLVLLVAGLVLLQ